MSYCRIRKGHSDLYVFENISGGFDCCGCNLHGGFRSFHCDTPEEMLSHLKKHKEDGQLVPDYAIDRLEHEIVNGVAII